VLCQAAFCVFATVAVLVFGLSASEASKWRRRPLDRIERGGNFELVVKGLLVVSVAVSVAYFVVVGYNVVILSIVGLFTTGELLTDVMSLRLESYAGKKYFAPGYVNQFKNTILPCLGMFFLARGLLSHGRAAKRDLSLAAVLSIPILLFLLGTGQRGAFVIALAMTVLFMNMVVRGPKLVVLNTALMGAGLVLFLGITFLIGRNGVSQLSDLSLGVALESLFSRVASANQYGGLIGYRYVEAIGPVWGTDWAQELRDLLPGAPSGLSIANKIFAIMYGSTRGTAPLSIHGSAYYNLGFLGSIMFFGFLGFVYTWVYVRFVRGPKTLFRALLYVGASVLLGTWVAGSPAFLANVGLMALVGMGVLVKVATMKRGRGRSPAPLSVGREGLEAGLDYR